MLKTDLNLASPDDVYELLVDAHRGLTDEDSRRLDARLILLLVNHVGDEAVIREAIAHARMSSPDASVTPADRPNGR